MSDDILSQDEVDALLKGVGSGDIETGSGEGRTPEGTRSYDFTSQERIIRGRMPGLEIVNERFSRYFRNSVSNLIMRFVDMSVQSIQIIKFGEFMKTVPFPSSINIFKMNPLKGYALAVIEAPLVFGLVEFFFGGKSTPYVKSEGRSFTSIENMVIRKITNLALADLASAWSVIIPVNPEYVWSEMNPQFVTIGTPSEIVIKVEVHVEVEDFTGKIFFCFPYSMVEPIKEKLYSGIQGEKFEIDQRWVAKLKEILLDSRVQVAVELGKTELTFGEIMGLDKGSVINIGKSIDGELDVSVEGVRKFHGRPGKSRNNQAVKITRIITENRKEII
ncbi:MAG: flagellar motor switch protein FliM [Nitrospiraceae bacterium]|nr:flagellar motor switch protein FliM [Nitrospiraceae bacterium]